MVVSWDSISTFCKENSTFFFLLKIKILQLYSISSLFLGTPISKISSRKLILIKILYIKNLTRLITRKKKRFNNKKTKLFPYQERGDYLQFSFSHLKLLVGHIHSTCICPSYVTFLLFKRKRY